MIEFKPENAVNSNGRFVMMTEGELQRQRQLNSEVIEQITAMRDQFKATTQALKTLAGSSEYTSKMYKQIAKLDKKLAGIAKTQYALKHQVLTAGEVVSNFNRVGITLVRTDSITSSATDRMVEVRSRAWLTVCDKLNEVDPNWYKYPGTGIENAVEAINRLAKAKN